MFERRRGRILLVSRFHGRTVGRIMFWCLGDHLMRCPRAIREAAWLRGAASCASSLMLIKAFTRVRNALATTLSRGFLTGASRDQGATHFCLRRPRHTRMPMTISSCDDRHLQSAAQASRSS